MTGHPVKERHLPPTVTGTLNRRVARVPAEETELPGRREAGDEDLERVGVNTQEEHTPRHTALRLARSCPRERRWGPLCPPCTGMAFSRLRCVHASPEWVTGSRHRRRRRCAGTVETAWAALRAHARGRCTARASDSVPEAACRQCLCNFLSNILTRTANFWQNAQDSADQMVGGLHAPTASASGEGLANWAAPQCRHVSGIKSHLCMRDG